MSQLGNPSAGGSPVAAGGAGGSPRGLRQIAGDFAHQPLAMTGLIVLALALLDTLVPPPLSNTETYHVLLQLQGPSGSHPLGTDALGRDELAQLLYGIHSSMLLVGATLALAAVTAASVLGVVHLLGRKRGQEWGRWAGVVLTPVVGVLVLGVASLVVGNPWGNVPSGFPTNLFSYVFFIAWKDVLQHPFSIGTVIQEGNDVSLLILFLLVGEFARVVYLLVQRLRTTRAAQPRADTASVTPAWVSIVVPAVTIGLWVAADALLLEALLEGYTFLGVAPIPTLGQMLIDAGSLINQAPWVVLTPLVAILVLYVSLNLVGFGLRGAPRR